MKIIAILTGDGKGKTTAAIGTAVRAVGWGKRVCIIQFIKSKEFSTGEQKAIEKYLKGHIEIKTLGLGFVGILGDKNSKAKHARACHKALSTALKTINSKQFDLVILDEVLGCISGKLLKTADVVNLVKNSPENVDIIITGRNAPKKLVKIANLVSEIKKIKHPYDKGILAKKGFDF